MRLDGSRRGTQTFRISILFFPVVGHPDLLVGTPIDFGDRFILSNARRGILAGPFFSLYKATLCPEIEATRLVAGSFRLMAFQPSWLNDRKHIPL